MGSGFLSSCALTGQVPVTTTARGRMASLTRAWWPGAWGCHGAKAHEDPEPVRSEVWFTPDKCKLLTLSRQLLIVSISIPGRKAAGRTFIRSAVSPFPSGPSKAPWGLARQSGLGSLAEDKLHGVTRRHTLTPLRAAQPSVPQPHGQEPTMQ